MCLFKCIGRLLLVLLNLTFLFLSVGLISTGVIISAFFERAFGRFVNPIWEIVRNDINTLHSTTLVENKDYLEKLYSYFAIVLIVAGVVLFFVSLFGFVGSCCHVKSLLQKYAVMIGGLILVQVVIVSLFIWTPNLMLKGMRGPLEDSITKYGGSNGTNGETWAWNFVMRAYGCCGIEDYTDFQKSSSWWEKSEHLTPYMCCKVFPTTAAEGDTCAGANNTVNPSTIASQNNYNSGCVNKAWQTIIVKHQKYVIIALFSFFCLQILVIVISCVLYRSDDDDDDGTRRQSKRGGQQHRKPKTKRPRKSVVVPAPTDDYW